MGTAKTRLPRVWEEIEQQHLELFEKSRKEFDLLFDESLKEAAQKLERERKEFVSQKRWLIVNFIGIVGVLASILAAIVVFLYQDQQPPPFFAS